MLAHDRYSLLSCSRRVERSLASHILIVVGVSTRPLSTAAIESLSQTVSRDVDELKPTSESATKLLNLPTSLLIVKSLFVLEAGEGKKYGIIVGTDSPNRWRDRC